MSAGHAPAPQFAGNPPNPPAPPSLEVVYDEIKAVADRVWNERDAVNTRSTFILTSASVIVGAATTISGAVSVASPLARTLIHWGIIVDVLIYVAAAALAGYAYTIEDFLDLNVDELARLRFKPDSETKQLVIGALKHNYGANQTALARKRGVNHAALLLLLAEVVWLGVLLGGVAMLAR